MKEHHTTTDFYGTKMPWEKSKTNPTTPKETGFMGAFSMASKADIDSLTEAFLSRQRQIQQRTLAPGRSAFLSER
jgi:hypothetical protein